MNDQTKHIIAILEKGRRSIYLIHEDEKELVEYYQLYRNRLIPKKPIQLSQVSTFIRKQIKKGYKIIHNETGIKNMAPLTTKYHRQDQ